MQASLATQKPFSPPLTRRHHHSRCPFHLSVKSASPKPSRSAAAASQAPSLVTSDTPQAKSHDSKLNKYSSRITEPKSQGGSQAILYGVGLSDDDMSKPQIGISSVWYEGNTCNMHLLQLAEAVREGVRETGMVGFRFNTIGVSDAISMGTRGMCYSLQSRDLIADSIETVMSAQWYDGNISIPGCDKNMPGTIMAMGRLNRPGIMVYGGTIKPGHFQDQTYDIVSAFQCYGEYVNGTISDDQRMHVVRNSCPGAGACGGMYTANTMAAAIETMGMSIPYSSSTPAEDPLKLDECRLAGKYLLELLKMDLKPRDIITERSLRNAMVMVMALGGSTNAVLHLIAIARSVELELTLDDFQKVSDQVPFLADLKPSGKYVMEDIHKIGGTPAVIRFLLEHGLLDGDCMTVTGNAEMTTLQMLKQLAPFFLPLFLFVLFLYKRLFPIPKPANLPPSPPKLPIIGNLHQIGGHPHRTLFTLSKRYGEIMFLQLGRRPTIVISSARLASQALRTFDMAFSGRPEYAIGKSMFYGQNDLVFGSYGDHWRHMRSVCVLQLLTIKRVQSFKQVREEEVALMASNIRKKSVVNLSDMFMLLTSNVICKVAFGRKCNDLIDSINFPKILKDLAELFGGNNIEDVLPWMAWVNWVNGVNFRVRKLTGQFDRLMEKILLEHVSRVKEATMDDSGDKAAMKDFVDILLEAQRDSNPKDVIIDNESIKGVLMDMFAAGTHTAYLTMEWAFTEILRHPRVMERLQEEVRSIVGDKDSVPEEDLEKMIYLKAVIKETLRVHPPLPFLIPRECTEDVKIDGYDVSAGTQVLINAWAIGRDPASWEEADSFAPERFLNSKIDVKGHDFQLIPFGSGRRICPGISFAMANVEIVLANIIYQFDWAVPLGIQKETLDTTETTGLTSHKRTPLILVPSPRIK